jgi:hypothetical protein
MLDKYVFHLASDISSIVPHQWSMMRKITQIRPLISYEIYCELIRILAYCNMFRLPLMPFGLLIGFTNNLQVVTTINYDTVAGLHTLQTIHTNLFTISSVGFTYPQYNTGAIPVSLYHPLPVPSQLSQTITDYHI